MTTQNSKIETRPWDPARNIRGDKEAADYLDVTLEAGFEDGYFRVVAPVIWDIVRYKGVENIARNVGIDAGRIEAALAGEGEPDLSLVLQVVRALGLQLRASVADAKAEG